MISNLSNVLKRNLPQLHCSKLIANPCIGSCPVTFNPKQLISPIFHSQVHYKFGADHHQIDREKIVLSNPKSGYFLDPNDVARRIIRIISQHDKVKNPENLTLNTQWWEMGIDHLDYVEIMIGVENDFGIEISDENLEKFKDINDAVEYVARSFFSV